MHIPAFEQAAKALDASSTRAAAVMADLKEAQRDLASPEETAARRARLAASSVARQTRLSAMVEARRTRGLHKIISTRELLTELKSLTAAIEDDLGGTDLSPWRDRVAKLADELEEDLFTPNPEPGMDWVPGGGGSEPRGEYDNSTQGVRNRFHSGGSL